MDQTQRLIRLRYPGSCAACGCPLARGARAWWDASAHRFTCTGCRPSGGGTTTTTAPASEPVQIDGGVAGASAQATFEKLHARREQRIEQSWGRLAGVVKFLTDDPQSTRAWATGSAGERLLAEQLERRIGNRAILLHDRRVPGTRGNIDHLAVAPSGVWIIDAKRYTGKVEHRDVGGWFRTDLRLFVGGRDRTKLVEGLGWQTAAVRRALVTLDSMGEAPVQLHQALCFVDADWPFLAKPFSHDGVRVSGPRSLADAVAEPGPLSDEEVHRVASHLAHKLPPARA
jgi:hypothetical protein